MALASNKDTHPQVLKRKIRLFTDQHGRKWWANIEGRSDHPCESLKPRGWRAPVKGGQPDNRYVRFNVDAENDQRIHIDYDALIQWYRDSRTEWARERDRVGRAQLKSAYDPQNPSDEVMDKVGPPPFPWEYWQACKNPDAYGHEWALGLSAEPPTWAALLFPDRVESVPFLRKPVDVTKPVASKRATAHA